MELAAALTILDRLSLEQRGKKLDQLEQIILTTAWHNNPYNTIDGYQEQTIKNKAVQLWEELSLLLNTKIRKQNLRQTLQQLHTLQPQTTSPSPRQFHGRLSELLQLQQWIASDRHQLITIHGMAGIGKTSLARQLAHNLSPQLDRIVTISLQNTPPLPTILTHIFKELGAGRQTKLSTNLPTAIHKTLSHLHHQRSLLILDNIHGNLPPDYLTFLQHLTTTQPKQPNTCLLLTTTPPPQFSIARSESPTHPQLQLNGLDPQACQQLLHNSHLQGTPADWQNLVSKYRGNPRYLKIIAPTIQDLFASNINNFLAADTLLFDRIDTAITAQFDRLTPAELTILNHLAHQTTPISFEQINTLQDSIPTRQILKALDRLLRKYLVEVESDRFSVPDMIREKAIERL